MRIKVEQHLDGLEKLGKPEFKRQVLSKSSQRLKFLMEKRVPMREGTLRRSADANSRFEEGRIVYSTPYAQYQYRLHTGNRTTPGTDGGWDEATLSAEGADFEKFVGATIAEVLS